MKQLTPVQLKEIDQCFNWVYENIRFAENARIINDGNKLCKKRREIIVMNNETPQDDYENMEKELQEAMTEASPASFPGLGKLLEIGEQLKDMDKELAAAFYGVEIICNETLPGNYWCITCGKQLYQWIKDTVPKRI